MIPAVEQDRNMSEYKRTLVDALLAEFPADFEGSVLAQGAVHLPLLTLVLGIGGSFQYGLHISLINSPSKHVQRFINSTWEQRYGSVLHPDTVMLFWSMIVAIYSIGGLLGSLIVGPMAVAFGRKKTQLYNNFVALVGAALMCTSRTAQSFEMIILGRFIYGINAGVSLNLHMMYIGECAPQNKRGMVTVTVSLSVAMGRMMGFVIGLREFLGTEELWPILLSVSAIPALIQLATLPFFPESPRYLLIDKGDKEGCLKAMQQLWGPGEHHSEIENMLAEKKAVGEQVKGVKDLLRDRSARWQMISLLLICGAVQLIGINAVYFYAYDVFQNAGIPAAKAPYVSLGTGIIEILTTVPCAFLIDSLGRKSLLWVNYSILALTLALLTVTLSFQDAYAWLPYVSCMLIFIFILSYGIGPGGVTCVLATEMFVQTYRPAAYTLSGVMIWLGLFVIGFAFPFIEETLGPFCFIFFLVYCLSMAAYSFQILPETKDQSMMEILESFNLLNFKSENDCRYVCFKKLGHVIKNTAVLMSKLVNLYSLTINAV
ncbi:solute carrier family 2, facilitated glucose transporter member 11-like [Gastrophryne carolinensis]